MTGIKNLHCPGAIFCSVGLQIFLLLHALSAFPCEKR